MHTKCCFVILVAIFLVKGTHAQTKAETLTNAQVVKLFKAGLDNDIILTKIESSNCKFDVSGDGLINLKTAGVPVDVIRAMVKKTEHTPGTVAVEKESAPVKKEPVQHGSTPEPELINAIYMYDKSLQSIQLLERNTASLKTQTVMLGYGGTNFVYQVPGEKSSMRLTGNEMKSFIVNTGTGPSDMFVLYKVQIKKKSRQAVAAKFALGGAQGSQGVIAIDVKMIKTGVYELIPSVRLEKGEYFFTMKTASNATSSNADVYAFGID